MVGRVKQVRWDDGEGYSRARIVVITEHWDFKPHGRNDDAEGAEAAENAEGEVGVEGAGATADAEHVEVAETIAS